MVAERISTQPAARSLTLREIPDDVYLAIKRAALEYNSAHPKARLGQTEIVSLIVREWISRGGQLPDPRRYEVP